MAAAAARAVPGPTASPEPAVLRAMCEDGRAAMPGTAANWIEMTGRRALHHLHEETARRNQRHRVPRDQLRAIDHSVELGVANVLRIFRRSCAAGLEVRTANVLTPVLQLSCIPGRSAREVVAAFEMFEGSHLGGGGAGQGRDADADVDADPAQLRAGSDSGSGNLPDALPGTGTAHCEGVEDPEAPIMGPAAFLTQGREARPLGRVGPREGRGLYITKVLPAEKLEALLLAVHEARGVVRRDGAEARRRPETDVENDSSRGPRAWLDPLPACEADGCGAAAVFGDPRDGVPIACAAHCSPLQAHVEPSPRAVLALAHVGL